MVVRPNPPATCQAVTPPLPGAVLPSCTPPFSSIRLSRTGGAQRDTGRSFHAPSAHIKLSGHQGASLRQWLRRGSPSVGHVQLESGELCDPAHAAVLQGVFPGYLTQPNVLLTSAFEPHAPGEMLPEGLIQTSHVTLPLRAPPLLL